MITNKIFWVVLLGISFLKFEGLMHGLMECLPQLFFMVLVFCAVVFIAFLAMIIRNKRYLAKNK